MYIYYSLDKTSKKKAGGIPNPAVNILVEVSYASAVYPSGQSVTLAAPS